MMNIVAYGKERPRVERPAGPIRWRSSLRNAIYDVLSGRPNWVETDSDTEWDFFWADKGWIHHELDKMHLNDWQRVNHFPNHYELTRKDLLIKNLKRAKKQLDREERYAEAAQYNFFPQTFVVPSEYRMFVEEFKRSGGTWIMKPIGRAQGTGIFLFNKLSQISDWRRGCNWQPNAETEEAPETYLAQRYVDQPYLVGGKKFDLRVYALVVNYSPLQVYLYRSGFARFTNTRYSSRKEDICNSYMHLTNVAIQKHAPGFDSAKGMKWSIRSLRMFLETRHTADGANELFHNIQNLIIRTLLAVQPAMINDKHCFELYGYDILIDAALKPWLIEVNASPSLSASDKSDQELKYGMLEDVLDVVDLDAKREPSTKPPLNVGGFDLIWDGGPVMRFNLPTSLPSMLGVYNELDKSQQRRAPLPAQSTTNSDAIDKPPKAKPAPSSTSASTAPASGGPTAAASEQASKQAPAGTPITTTNNVASLMANAQQQGTQDVGPAQATAGMPKEAAGAGAAASVEATNGRARSGEASGAKSASAGGGAQGSENSLQEPGSTGQGVQGPGSSNSVAGAPHQAGEGGSTQEGADSRQHGGKGRTAGGTEGELAAGVGWGAAGQVMQVQADKNDRQELQVQFPSGAE